MDDPFDGISDTDLVQLSIDWLAKPAHEREAVGLDVWSEASAMMKAEIDRRRGQ